MSLCSERILNDTSCIAIAKMQGGEGLAGMSSSATLVLNREPCRLQPCLATWLPNQWFWGIVSYCNMEVSSQRKKKTQTKYDGGPGTFLSFPLS